MYLLSNSKVSPRSLESEFETALQVSLYDDVEREVCVLHMDCFSILNMDFGLFNYCVG